MTIIAGFDDGKNVVIGSDSMLSYEGSVPPIKYEGIDKIISRKNYHIGFSNSMRIAEILEESKILPVSLTNEKQLKKLRDEWFQILVNDWDLGVKEPSSGLIMVSSELLIATTFGLWELGSDFSLAKAQYGAIGAGMATSLGALHLATKYKWNAEEAVRNAVECSVLHNTYCGGETKIVTIRKKK